MKTESKKFQAILAKNEIAREIKRYIQKKEEISWPYIFVRMRDIERYIGVDNQPSFDDIINTTADI